MHISEVSGWAKLYDYTADQRKAQKKKHMGGTLNSWLVNKLIRDFRSESTYFGQISRIPKRELKGILEGLPY